MSTSEKEVKDVEEQKNESVDAVEEEKQNDKDENESKEAKPKKQRTKKKAPTEAPAAPVRSSVREKKQTQALTVEAAEEFSVIEGPGSDLGSISWLNEKFDEIPSSDPLYKKLFSACFPYTRSSGQKTTIKKFLKQFSGFDSQENSDKSKARLEGFENKHLKAIASFLNLSTSGTKEVLCDKIHEFLKSPSNSGSKSSGSSKSKSKRKSSSSSDKPKRPLTAFFVFSNEKRAALKKKFPELKTTELSKKLGEMWAELSQEEKAKYQSSDSNNSNNNNEETNTEDEEEANPETDDEQAENQSKQTKKSKKENHSESEWSQVKSQFEEAILDFVNKQEDKDTVTFKKIKENLPSSLTSYLLDDKFKDKVKELAIQILNSNQKSDDNNMQTEKEEEN